jgi:hypothetical protein
MGGSNAALVSRYLNAGTVARVPAWGNTTVVDLG